jgi:hypothetical protein
LDELQQVFYQRALGFGPAASCSRGRRRIGLCVEARRSRRSRKSQAG